MTLVLPKWKDIDNKSWWFVPDKLAIMNKRWCDFAAFVTLFRGQCASEGTQSLTFFGHEDSEAKTTLTFHHRWWPTLQVLRFPYLFALQEHDAARIFKARPQWTHAPGLHLRRCMVGLERLWSTVCLSAWLLLWELCSKFATLGMMKVYVGIFHRCRRDGGGSGSHLEMVGNCLSIPFGKKWHKFSYSMSQVTWYPTE